MTDNKLIQDEEQRAANYEALKSTVESDVAGDIALEADTTPSGEIGAVAENMRSRAVGEVTQTQREVDRGRIAARASQIVDYIFFVIYGLLAIRLMLELFAAREGAAFFRLIKTLTDPLYWPFRGLVPSPSTPDGFALDLPLIVAIFVYALLHMAINGIFRIMAHRKVEI